MQLKSQLFFQKMDFSYAPDVVYLFIRLRILIEEHGLKKELPTLNLYCNWLVHQKLDRSSCSIISELKEEIKKHMSSGNNINLSMSCVLGVDKLNKEIQYALSYCDLPPEKKQIDWRQLSVTLFMELIDRPIISIDKDELEYPYDFNGIKLIEYNGRISWELLSPSLEGKNSRIIGSLVEIKNVQP